MRPAVSDKPASVPTPKPTRPNVARLLRTAVVITTLAGSLGLATTTAGAQTDGDPADPADFTCPKGTDPLPFSDVAPDNTHYEDIRCLVELGIATPSNNRYRPREEVTREEMAAFMARTYRAVTGVDAEVPETPFTDIPEGSFAAADIARIHGLGITSGTTATTYSPKAAVLRSHMALFLVRLYKTLRGFDPPVVSTDFTDIARRTKEQRDAIAQIYGLGITTGTTPTTFAPRAGVTRQEMGSFVARLYRTLVATGAEAPTDVNARPTGDGTELTVTWNPPAAGGRAATSYVVQWKSGNEDYATTRQQNTRTASTRITGLTRGAEYTLRVASTNATATGPWSPEAEGTPAVAPGPVGSFNVAPGNTELVLTWEPPADDGGSDVTGYIVQWTADSRVQPSQHRIDDPAARTHTITGLRNNTTANPSSYYVWITALNAAGAGPRAPAPNGGPVSPTTVAPGPPTGLAATASATSGTELIVKWKAPLDDGGEPVVSYRVERNCADGRGSGWVTTGIPGNPAGRVDVSNVPTETYTTTITGLVNGQPCRVRVRAVNTKSSPTGPWLWAYATATPVQVTGPPILTADGVVSAHRSLQVTWAPPSRTGGTTVTGYEVSYASGGAPKQINVAGTVTTTTITGLTNGLAYTVSVKAVSAAGRSRPSAEITAVPKPVPGAPRNLTAGPPPAVDAAGTPVVVDPESLRVTWSPPAANGTNDVLGYILQYRESSVPPSSPGANDALPAGVWTRAPVSAAAVTRRSVTVSGLKDRRSGSATGRGVSFDIRVRATNDHDSDGTTGNSSPAEGGPWAQTSATPATQPASIGADEAASRTNIDVETGFRRLTVTWNPPDDGGAPITHYLLRHAAGATGRFVPDIRINAPANRYTLTGLADGTSYTVVIRAVNAVGAGASSHGISGSTSSVPPAPQMVTAAAATVNSDGAPGDGTQLAVSWTAVTRTNGGPPITGYEVQYRRLADPDRPVPDARYPAHVWQTVDGDAQSTGTDFPLGALSAQITGLDVGASYEVRVRAVTRSGSVGSSGYAAIVKTAGIPSNVSIVSVRINDAVAGEPDSTKVITWSAGGQGLQGVTSYTVRWFPSVAGARGSSGAVIVGVGTQSHTVSGLAPGTYVAKVSACNSIGCTGEVQSSYDTRTRSGDQVTVP